MHTVVQQRAKQQEVLQAAEKVSLAELQEAQTTAGQVADFSGAELPRNLGFQTLKRDLEKN